MHALCVRVCGKNYEVLSAGNLRMCVDEATNFSGLEFFFLSFGAVTFLQIYFYTLYKSGLSVFWT